MNLCADARASVYRCIYMYLIRKHKIGRIPSHKASQKFSTSSFESALDLDSENEIEPKIGRIPSHKASQKFSTSSFESALDLDSENEVELKIGRIPRRPRTSRLARSNQRYEVANHKILKSVVRFWGWGENARWLQGGSGEAPGHQCSFGWPSLTT